MKKFILSFAYLSFTLSFATTSQDSTTDTSDDNTKKVGQLNILDKIITSATGFDLPLRDEPKNIYVFGKEDLENKGYSDLNQALQYQPFITLQYSSFGSNIDLRGQGTDANRAVKILVNRVPISLLDTSHGVAAFNQIDIEDIESIEVIPGGGAVVYGNGTRGGVVNIVTKKPTKDFYRAVLKLTSGERAGLQGGQLSLATGKKTSDHLFTRVGVSIGYTPGARNTEGTLSTNSSIKAFENDNTTNLYTSFQALWDINENNKIDFNIVYSHVWQNKPYDYLVLSTGKTGRYEPDVDTVKTQTDSLQTSLNYTTNFSDNLSFDAIAFYQLSIVKYTQYYTGTPATAGYMNYYGTGFENHGGGINLKIKWLVGNNTFIAGLDNVLESSSRVNLMTHLISANMNYTTNVQNDATKLSESIYVFNTYKFSEKFDLSAGARIEYSHYWVSSINNLVYNLTYTGGGMISLGYDNYSGAENRLGYAADITPNYKYSDTGNVYTKLELGFISPSAYQMINTDPSNSANASNTSLCGSTRQLVCYATSNNLQPEQYITGEVGWKDEFEWSYMSATIFYTHTFNEIYTNSIQHGTSYTYGNLGQTQRYGIEFLARQSLGDDDIVRLSESISPLLSNVLKANSVNAGLRGHMIPYVPWLKVTLNFEIDIIKEDRTTLSAFINNAYYSQSTSLSGATKTQVVYTPVIMNKYGYLLTDVGINYGYKDLKVNAGIRNLFDVWYATYQKGEMYMPGMGRSYYIELRYTLQ